MDSAATACRRWRLQRPAGRLALLCVGALGLVMARWPAVAQQQVPTEALGRWENRPVRCLRSWAGAPAGPCASVVLDQRTAGVMRLLLLAPAAPPLAYTQLSFVGQLQPGSEPMGCRQGVCKLSKPLTLLLSSVSQAAFDDRGLARGVPSGWPVTGQCRLQPERISCEARAQSGEIWMAEARGQR